MGWREALKETITKNKKENDMSSEKVVYSKWIKKGTSTFIPTDNSKIVETVEAGVYDLRYSDGIGFYMFKKEVHLDELLIFPNSVHTEVISCVKDFWERKEKFKEYGFAFKRGILMHGPAGSGKSCIINILSDYIIKNLNGVIFPLSDSGSLGLYASCIPEIFRVIEPERPIFVILEDLENFCTNQSNESKLLNILDGIEQLENVVYVGTSNFPEFLKERITNRPSRFDRRIFVPMPSAKDRKFYFQNKLHQNDLEKIDLKAWVKDTKGLSVAHLAELIKTVIIFGTEYKEAIALLKEMNNVDDLHSNKHKKKSTSLGFGTKEDGDDEWAEEDFSKALTKIKDAFKVNKGEILISSYVVTDEKGNIGMNFLETQSDGPYYDDSQNGAEECGSDDFKQPKENYGSGKKSKN